MSTVTRSVSEEPKNLESSPSSLTHQATFETASILSNRALLAGTALALLLLASAGCQPADSSSLAGGSAGFRRHGQILFAHNVPEGLALAEHQQMPVLLFFTAEWCTYCKQMEATVFYDQQVGLLAEKFVCILVDADQFPQLCQRFAVRGFPTIEIVAADGRSLQRLVGRQSANSLALGMQAALRQVAWLDEAGRKLR